MQAGYVTDLLNFAQYSSELPPFWARYAMIFGGFDLSLRSCCNAAWCDIVALLYQPETVQAMEIPAARRKKRDPARAASADSADLQSTKQAQDG